MVRILYAKPLSGEKGILKKMKRFAFIIHPRDTRDIRRRLWLTRCLPRKMVDAVVKRLSGRAGYTVCSKFNVFGRVEGYLIAVLLTGEQMMTLPPKFVRKRILDAVLFAQNQLKVEVVGLGALTPSFTNKGQWITRHAEVRVNVTHGDSYTVAVALEGIERIIDLRHFQRRETQIAIVGAYGLIGKTLSMFLSKEGYRLILIGRSRAKLERVRQEIKDSGSNSDTFISTDLMSAYDADIVVTATSHPGSLIRSEHLKRNAVVYGLSQPANISQDLLRVRPDMIKIDGGYARIDNINLGFEMGPPSGVTFACLTETIMQTLKGESNHHVGEIELSYVERTKKWAKEYGFSHAPFSCFDIPLGLDDLLGSDDLSEEVSGEIVDIKILRREKFIKMEGGDENSKIKPEINRRRGFRKVWMRLG